MLLPRLLLATLLGAIVFFVWGALVWTVLQLHTLHTIENEQEVVKVLSEAITEPGVYWFPNLPTNFNSADKQTQEVLWEATMDRHRAGPIMINFHPSGQEPMPPATFIKGFALNIAAALLGSLLLVTTSISSYWGRVVFIAAIGVIVGISAHLMYWNYLLFPLDYSIMQLLDSTLGWLFAGLVIAGLVPGPKKG